MEDWISAIKEKMLAHRANLPPEDWNWFDAHYFKARRWRILPWVIASTSIAAAVALLLILRLSQGNALDEPVAESSIEPVSSNEVLPRISTPERSVKEAYLSSADDVLLRERPVISTDTMAVAKAEPVMAKSEKADNSGIGQNASSEMDSNVVRVLGQTDRERPAGRRFSFSTSTSGYFSTSTRQHSYSAFKGLDGFSGMPPGFLDGALIDSGIGDFDQKVRAHHQMPLSIEFDASTFLTSNLALTTGLSLSFYQSRFTNENMVESKSTYQRAYYLGIPLRIDWMVWEQERFCAWLGVGGKADYLVYGKIDNRRLTDQSIHWSVLGDIGIQYKLTTTVGLFLQPEFSYYLRPSNPALLTYRTNHPLSFVLGAGLRWTLVHR